MVGKDDLTYDVVLDADIQPAFNLKAAASGQDLRLSWEAPLTEFRHDNGVPATYLGWNHGHAKAAIFATYRQKILVKEVRFYLSDVSGPHANINVFLVGLNKDGYPNVSDMRWLAKGVTFKNNEWTSVVLENPVEMENFAIGISGDGYIGLGASASDSTHPFESLMHFWAADDMYNPYDFNDFDTWAPVHPMLRVCGDYLGNPSSDPLRESLSFNRVTRPSTEYDIFRIEYGNPDDWTHLGSTRGLDYSDETFKDLADGKDYRYAVVARYGKIEAEPVLSNIVTKDASSVDTVLTGDISFGPNPFISTLSVTHPEKISQLRFISLDGTCLKTITSVATDNDVSDLPDGMYVVMALCIDGNVMTEKMIKK
ncbi:MAG: T9SS type A sorting domain-containing protein, partial [Muribaculaceae bacterium]|nr:T9SS type A sorting domain-containing protein [Muribaculaceae bacterium]